MPSPGPRQFTIVLVTIVAQAAIGFSVERTTETVVGTEYSADLATQESVLVKSIVNTNDIRQDKDDTNKGTKNKDRFSSEEKNDNMEQTKSTSTDDVRTETDKPVANINGTDVINNNYSEVPSTDGFSSDTTTFDSKTITNDILTPTESTTSRNEYVTDLSLLSVSSINITNKENLNSTADPSHIIKEYISVSSIASNRMETESINVTGLSTINDQIAIDTRSSNNPNDSSTLPNAYSSLDKMNKVELKTINTQTPPTATLDAPGYKPEGGKLGSLESIADISHKDLFLVEKNVEHALNQTTEPTHEELTSTDGENVLTLQETSFSNEKQINMVEAETRQTTLPIPSLENHREVLNPNNNELSTIRYPEHLMVTEGTTASESIVNTQLETETMVSKRAGFLDYSKKSFATGDESNTAIHNSISRLPTHRNKDAETADLESQRITKLTAYESRTLAEDAMREEELLKFRVSDQTKPTEGDQVTTNSQAEANTDSWITKSERVIEDTLSVQPINQDRRTTLYTVGPNYKPMKRLEVQPAKPFVRDPDDNSWRNESISSLGIVFKPKNSSSKSFKEVLKTKTEIELSYSQDKDNKGEAPELRERLEKITEVRKRKKKIDKFGEVVYTDYEEGSSAEEARAPPADSRGPGAPEADSRGPSPPGADIRGPSTPGADVEGTSPMTTTTSSSYWINQLAISKEDMFKDLGLDVPNTQKPKKPYNLAEYYDTTDEYDVDYMTMPNIDIKKYTLSQRPSTTPPTRAAPLAAPASPPSATRRPRLFPDRQPTLQYFPPTTRPPKVSMNDYDVNFENRVKAYTQQTAKSAPESRAPTAAAPRLRPATRPADATPSPPAARHLVIASPGLERGSFVIRHLGEFLSRAAAREEEARAPDFPAFTAPPAPPAPRDYDDELAYRRDVVDRFVDSFNTESDRFSAEFPVLVNSSVLHGAGPASSSTFMKRLLGGGGGAGGARACAPAACAPLVELSPAYELHYYVPEQEEREAPDAGPRAAPPRPAPYGAL